MSNNLEILLVSEEKIKSFTTLNTNLAPEDLVPHIFNAQNIVLPNSLGMTYYSALKDRVGSGTLTAADEFLLDQYIGPLICNYALYYASTFISYKLYNKGILKGTSENGETLGIDELRFLQSQIKMIAESYSDQMTHYMRMNSVDYPLYNSASSLDGYLPNKGSKYTTNLVTPNFPYAGSQRAYRGAINSGFGYQSGCYNEPNSGN